jgi:excisionase family DNA binding protein
MPTAAPVRQYETIAQAAERTNVSTKTIRRRIAEGQLTAYRFGPQSIRLNPAEVDGLMRPISTAGTAA